MLGSRQSLHKASIQNQYRTHKWKPLAGTISLAREWTSLVPPQLEISSQVEIILFGRRLFTASRDVFTSSLLRQSAVLVFDEDDISGSKSLLNSRLSVCF